MAIRVVLRLQLLVVGDQPSELLPEQLALFEAGDISATEMRDQVIRHARREWKA
jgi:hypothetical protein